MGLEGAGKQGAVAKKWAEKLGSFALRVLVPLWIGAGAATKLLDNAPSALPVPVIAIAKKLGLDLEFVLGYSVGVELTVIGVVLFLPELAKGAALALLGAFAPILLWEIATGAASCGCFGSITVPPWVTFTADMALLVCALVARTRRGKMPELRVALAVLWTVAAFGVAFGYTAARKPDAGKAEAKLELPSYYLPQPESWVGKSWDDVPVAKYVGNLPDEIAHGEGLVIFYRYDCDHCHDLLSLYFDGQPPVPTLLVAVPNKDGFPEKKYPQPCTGCLERKLPTGCDWLFETPTVVRLEGGKVVCAGVEDPLAPSCVPE